MGRAARSIDSGSAFDAYASELKAKYKFKEAREHAYRPALQNYVESLERGVAAINDAARIQCGGPDFIVYKKRVPVGYIETKDIGESLDKVEKSDQGKRYLSGLSNLIITDYLEFRWYVNGEKRLTVRVGEAASNRISFVSNAETQLTSLVQSFLNAEVPTIKTAEELAHRLAGSTTNIYELIRKAYDLEENKGWLHRWLNAFSEVLISDLDRDTFADMFAQTLAYGFFAARVHHADQSEFSRFAAAKILPKTNPFLRQLFAEFAGVNMPDEINWAVDEIIELLKLADMKSILRNFGKESAKDDPVVHFYETFLTAYDPSLREKRGVYYTPVPVVDYITGAVDEILETHFNKKNGLADDGTLILDPGVGTASFLYKVVERIHARFSKNEGMWDSYVGESLLERVFGFEILMAPYAVSHLKLGLQLQDTGYKFQRDQRLGIFLTNTLEEAARKSQEMLFDWISREANAASAIKKDRPIMVVIGNPPYSGESANKGKWIHELLRGKDSINNKQTANYFECEGKPLGEKNPKWLNDDYVKFIRFAQWRIEQTGHGILAFVTNHGYLDNPTFRGMRETLLKTFDEIYILDLHGNTKKKEVAASGKPDQNVFDIQQGVAIGLFVRKQAADRKQAKEQLAKVFRNDLLGTREDKYNWLRKTSFSETKWEAINPKSPFYRFECQNDALWGEYNLGWKVTDIFPVHSVGIATGRDKLTIQFSEDEVHETVKSFAKMPDAEARETWKLGDDARDWKVSRARKDVLDTKASRDRIISVLYRPFDKRYTYYTGNSRGFLCMPRPAVANQMVKKNNIALITSRMTKGEVFRHVHFTSDMAEVICLSPNTSNNGFVFPLRVFSSDEELQLKKGGMWFNFKKDFLEAVEQRSGIKFSEKNNGNGTDKFGAEDLFYYISAILSSPDYQNRYTECLKVDFPRIPITVDVKLFWRLVKIGSDVVSCHLMKDTKEATNFPEKGSNIVDKSEYDGQGRIFINDRQYFDGVSEAVFGFYVGGYAACAKWLKSRKGKKLSLTEIRHFGRMVGAIEQILAHQQSLDDTLRQYGGIKNLFSPNAYPIEASHRR
ncbi:MAG TPA: N-6 DNA methylase [Nitrospira sp.]|nr:N-6 DNA methylase [Nitrospira sp.]